MKPRFLADENIDQDLVFGLRRRVDDADIVRVQDVGLRTVDDQQILQWAADERRQSLDGMTEVRWTTWSSRHT
ncbi:MAG: DUF5615 family PIN-like protein [Nesterenkonia sp.]|nr:DUF5615 family PIN-like protein [Nesterenkonia sp.]